MNVLSTKSVLIVLGVAGLAAAFALNASSGDETPPPRTAAHDPDAQSPSGASVPGLSEPGIVSWYEPDFVQSFTATKIAREFTIRDQEFDATTGNWTETRYTETATFSISTATGNGRDWFYLAGVSDAGDVVIQQWRLKPPKVKVVGGSGTPPGKVLKRVELYRGTLETPIVSMRVDPERRFLLALVGAAGERRLYSFPVQVGATPTLFADYVQIPELSNATSMNRIQHALLGRLWMVRDQLSPGFEIVFIDSDNDGVFDGPPIIHTHSSILSSGILDPDSWVDTFMGVG